MTLLKRDDSRAPLTIINQRELSKPHSRLEHADLNHHIHLKRHDIILTLPVLVQVREPREEIFIRALRRHDRLLKIVKHLGVPLYSRLLFRQGVIHAHHTLVVGLDELGDEVLHHAEDELKFVIVDDPVLVVNHELDQFFEREVLFDHRRNPHAARAFENDVEYAAKVPVFYDHFSLFERFVLEDFEDQAQRVLSVFVLVLFEERVVSEEATQVLYLALVPFEWL